MQITLDKIKLFTKCPRYYWFIQETRTKPIKMDLSIATSIIKKCYCTTMETGFKVEYRKVLEWVNQRIFRDVDVKDKAQFKVAHKLAEYIMKFLHHWYYKIYIEEQVASYVDIKLEIMMGSNLIETTLPIIKIEDDTPTIMNISNEWLEGRQLSNNIEICGKMALLYGYLGCNMVIYKHLYMRKEGGFQSSFVRANEKRNIRCAKMLYDIAQAINNKVNYPCVSTHCDTCPFRRNCKI